MSEYTKGPWTYNQGSGTVSAICGPTRRVVARYVDPNNAHLIAAAPEMYEAIAEFVARCEAGEIRSRKTYAKFKAILAKAEGR